MSTQLEKFDPSALMDGVRARIKATFVSLIPEQHWQELCQKEIDNFFKEQKSNYNSVEYKSDFRNVCKEILTEVSKEKVKQFLSEYDSSIWVVDGFKCSDALGALIVKMAPEIFAATFGNMFQNAVTQMKRY